MGSSGGGLSGAYAALSAQPYNVLDSGNPQRNAIGDGASHPLSERFGSLTAARVVFPRAAALTEEIDRHAIQYALDTADSVVIPSPTAGGPYVIDVRSVVVASVSITGNVATIVTAAAHGYTAGDVAAAATVHVGGFTTATDTTNLSFLNSTSDYVVTGITSDTALTVAVAHADLAAKTPVAGSHPAVRLRAGLYTRAADSGAVYGNAGASAAGLGYQTITAGPRAVLQLRSGSNIFPNAGAVFASGNARQVSAWSNPAVATFCPHLTLDGLRVDGNRAAASTFANEPAVLLYGCADLRVPSIEVYNAAGYGIWNYGIAAVAGYTERQHWGVVNCHDNGQTGFRASLRLRKVRYENLQLWNNGQAVTFTGAQAANGCYIDHSELIIGSINAYDNVGHGVVIHNVYSHNDAAITARGNGGHGIYVSGFVASHGGQWVAADNGQAAANTYDDIHFDITQSGNYGPSGQSTVNSIVAGYDIQTGITDAYTNSARYNVYLDDDNGDLHLLGVRYLGAGVSGTYRGPSTTAAGVNGDVFTYVPQGSLNCQLVAGSAQVVAGNNSATETTFASVTLPSNTLRAGSSYELEMWGTTDNIATSGNFNFKTKIGSLFINYQTASASANTGKAWFITARITVRGTGAAAVVAMGAFGRIEFSALTATGAAPSGGTTIDTTQPVTLSLTGQTATANAGNIIRCEGANIRRLAA